MAPLLAFNKFQRHECVRRERTGQIARLFRRETESRIVFFVSKHDDDAFPDPVELLERPDADALEAGQNDVTVERFSHPRRVAASGGR